MILDKPTAFLGDKFIRSHAFRKEPGSSGKLREGSKSRSLKPRQTSQKRETSLLKVPGKFIIPDKEKEMETVNFSGIVLIKKHPNHVGS